VTLVNGHGKDQTVLLLVDLVSCFAGCKWTAL